MASGAEHRKRYLAIWRFWRAAGTVVLALAATAMALGIFGTDAEPWLRALVIASGLLLAQIGMGIWVGPYVGMIANPDMDMENGRRGHTYIKRWPLWAKRWWAEFWREYSERIPHRSAKSHAPGVSTSIRLNYLLRPVKARTGPLWHLLRILAAPLLAFIWLGMYRQDMSHALLDKWFAQQGKR